MSHLMLFAGTVALTLVVVLIGGWFVRRQNKKRRAKIEATFAELKREADSALPKKCQNCKHWNQEAGQHTLRSLPVFNKVIEHVSPNQQYGEKVFAEDTDDAGNKRRYVKEVKPLYPVHEDRWEFFGLCMPDSRLIHRTGTCDSYEAK